MTPLGDLQDVQGGGCAPPLRNSATASRRAMDELVSSMFAGTFQEAVSMVIERARSGSGGFVVQCNLHVLMSAERDPEVLRALREACRVMPDGAPVVWLQRRRGLRRAHRIAGPDLISAVLDAGRNAELRHAFVGSTDEVLQSLVRSSLEKYPGVAIVAAHSPGFGGVDQLGDVVSVREQRADIVWVAFGAPKQELWMRRHAAALSPALLVGVGAAFDIHAGVRRRSPRPLQRLGLEWVWRWAHEPRRLSGRYLQTGAAFARYLTRRPVETDAS